MEKKNIRMTEREKKKEQLSKLFQIYIIKFMISKKKTYLYIYRSRVTITIIFLIEVHI